MLSDSPSLEEKLENPDWKQWIPVFGVREIYRANFIEKAPAINDDPVNHPIRYEVSNWYHAATSAIAVVGAAYGVFKIVEKLS